jgi:hypothetical protein
MLQIKFASANLNPVIKDEFPQVHLLFITFLLLIAAGSGTALFLTRMRLLDSAASSSLRLPDADRYRPMLRLLSTADLDFASGNPALSRKIRASRRAIFRGYLRCLTKDYGRLLSGIRQMMVESGVDRPDLAKALAKNRLMFAVALCRIEICLQLHALGIGRVDVSGLVEALAALRGAVSTMTPATGGAWAS